LLSKDKANTTGSAFAAAQAASSRHSYPVMQAGHKKTCFMMEQVLFIKTLRPAGRL
jgi:hypothetical protein